MGKEIRYTGASQVTRKLCALHNESQTEGNVHTLAEAMALATEAIVSLGKWPYYSPVQTYKAGDTCRQGLKVYSCRQAITTPEAWVSSHWSLVEDVQVKINTILDMISGI